MPSCRGKQIPFGDLTSYCMKNKVRPLREVLF
jgi:hypothetical protein